ncbi:MAG TPA: hypothetical protein VK780_09470, partial [Thermoanaerobaculia bacterium]|nr:hypothetical protein [Thermoanaerobaculia bacterium]
RPPLSALAYWGGAMVAILVAFAPGRWPRVRLVRSETAGRAALLLAILALAGWERLADPGRMPPAFGGDEVLQIVEGTALWNGSNRSNLFGMGRYQAMRLSLLPGAIGKLLFEDRIGGPRLVHGLIGTASVVLAAAAAWLIAGPWAGIGCAAVLAFAPHHVHFSRIASHMILDSLTAGALLLAMLALRRSPSPGTAAITGLVAGLALYGYFGGRVIGLTFLLGLLPAVARVRPRRRAANLVAISLLAFLVVAAPTLWWGAQHPESWAHRHTSIFNPVWWNFKVAEFGSPARVLREQFLAGTIDLLSTESSWEWFTGYPMLEPVFLLPLFLAGCGWLVGRKRFFEAALLCLLAAGNFALVVFSESAPAPQRASSLVPVLAIGGGVAIAAAGLLFPARTRSSFPARTVAGTLAAAAILLWTFRGSPGIWNPSIGYGGDGAALPNGAWLLLRAPRWAGASVSLHSLPEISSKHPDFGYLLPKISWVDVDPDKDFFPPSPGLHLFFRESIEKGREWQQCLLLPYGIALPDLDNPVRDIAYAVLVPETEAAGGLLPEASKKAD